MTSSREFRKALTSASKSILSTVAALSLFFGSNFPILGVFVCKGTAFGAEPAQQNQTIKVRCIALECYTNLSDESTKAQVEFIRGWVESRRGVKLKVYDLEASDKEPERLKQIEAAYKVSQRQLPVVYGMNHVLAGPRDNEQWKSELVKLLTMQVFVRQGCSKCAAAKEYLPSFLGRYPGIEVRYMDVVNDAAANQSYNDLARSQRIGGISFPGFWFCRQLVVGFDSASSTGGRLEGGLKKWTFDCELPKVVSYQQRPTEVWKHTASLATWIGPTASLTSFISAQSQDDPPPLEIGDSSSDLPIPVDASQGIGEQGNAADPSIPGADEVDVPLLGRISASRMGMPAFTFLIGLVDGFNPCAMWVLLFLLSVLVNLRVRWKILAVAGTFVVVSGVAYFVFMAAWLNVLLFVGLLRWVQILLAMLAIFVGSVHVKDFFAFKRGLSLSIPESAKPGIYARVRSIVMAEHIYGAISGAFVLAVLVNIIELLCTAGLPALYSQILMLQGYPSWKNYAYLALYIVAYMLDDSIMVGLVILTLGKRKMQENEGRWLKLASGLVILALGIVLLFKPDWLV